MNEEQLKIDADTRALEGWKNNQRYLMDKLHENEEKVSQLIMKVEFLMCHYRKGDMLPFTCAGIGSVVGIATYELLKYMFS